MREGRRRAALSVGALLVAVLLPALSFAATRTTAPNNKVTVLVVIDDKGITVHSFVGLGNQGLGQKGSENEPASLQALLGPIPRGDFLSFNVFNRGKKLHDFTIFGKKTPPIKPGRKAHLFAQAVRRGSFQYRSTLDRSRSFRGYFTVF